MSLGVPGITLELSFVSCAFFTDSTMINHNFSPPFGESFLDFFQPLIWGLYFIPTTGHTQNQKNPMSIS